MAHQANPGQFVLANKILLKTATFIHLKKLSVVAFASQQNSVVPSETVWAESLKYLSCGPLQEVCQTQYTIQHDARCGGKKISELPLYKLFYLIYLNFCFCMFSNINTAETCNI